MTQIEKARAYDKAFKEAESIHRLSSNIAEIKRMEQIFPELKMSEDERIRKDLIQYLYSLGALDNRKYINWLEKQGEKMFDQRYRILTKLIEADDIYQMSVNDAMVKEAKNKAIEALSNLEISKLLGLEKQDKQKYKFRVGDTIKEKSTGDIVTICEIDLKNREYRLSNTGFIPFKYEYLWELVEQPADKVEPKFKVGDWIVSGYNSVAYIESISETKYNLQCKDGSHEKLSIDYINRCWHLWTIQDAKDGDVLVTEPINDYTSPFIAIYKERELDFFNSYCFIGFDGNFYEGTVGHNIKCIHPATKEQRDILLQKMKEEGYKWNAEKKELKKIESNLSEFEIAVKNVMEEAIEAGDTHNLKADAENLLRIIRPTWSEEDEGRLKSCLNILQPKTFTGKKVETINTKWLKSLKERLL